MEQRDRNGLTEKEFLEAYAKKNYPRPYVTADLVVFTEGEPEVLLVRRKGHPYIGRWAFPGGFTEEGETLEQSAARELKEETGIDCQFLSQFKAFGDPGRDPRGRTITIVFYAYVDEDTEAVADDDAADVDWFDFNSLPALAFDHARILEEFLLANH